MKVAILHPSFLMRGGAERVVEILAGIYPGADIYSLFVDPGMLSPILRSRGVQPSILNAFPFSSRLYRHLLPFYPWAVESFDLREYDLVISSCGPAMMGCSIRQDATHICYCHSPERNEFRDKYGRASVSLDCVGAVRQNTSLSLQLSEIRAREEAAHFGRELAS